MSRWGAALALTQDMLSAAHAGDFDRVSVLEVERRALLDMPIVTAGEAVPELARIVECDRALVRIVEGAHRFAGEQLRHARLAQAGAGTYLGVAFAR